MTRRERSIKAANLGRRIPGGPSGEFAEREQVLKMMGVSRIQATRKIFLLASEGAMLDLAELKERSARRAKAFGWQLVGNPPHWDW
jgi:hypothetical protein